MCTSRWPCARVHSTPGMIPAVHQALLDICSPVSILAFETSCAGCASMPCCLIWFSAVVQGDLPKNLRQLCGSVHGWSRQFRRRHEALVCQQPIPPHCSQRMDTRRRYVFLPLATSMCGYCNPITDICDGSGAKGMSVYGPVFQGGSWTVFWINCHLSVHLHISLCHSLGYLSSWWQTNALQWNTTPVGCLEWPIMAETRTTRSSTSPSQLCHGWTNSMWRLGKQWSTCIHTYCDSLELVLLCSISGEWLKGGHSCRGWRTSWPKTSARWTSVTCQSVEFSYRTMWPSPALQSHDAHSCVSNRANIRHASIIMSSSTESCTSLCFQLGKYQTCKHYRVNMLSWMALVSPTITVSRNPTANKLTTYPKDIRWGGCCVGSAGEYHAFLLLQRDHVTWCLHTTVCM